MPTVNRSLLCARDGSHTSTNTEEYRPPTCKFRIFIFCFGLVANEHFVLTVNKPVKILSTASVKKRNENSDVGRITSERCTNAL